MFLGHFAVAFAAKKAAPAVSFGMLVASAQFADLLWPVLVLAGVERVAIDPGNTAVTPLDFIHYPYSHSLVALLAWGAALGLGWHAVARGGWRAALELASLAVGLGLYLRTTRARDRIGRIALGGFVVFLLATYAGAVLGPPPPSVGAVAGSCLAMWLLVAWAAWFDRHRERA